MSISTLSDKEKRSLLSLKYELWQRKKPTKTNFLMDKMTVFMSQISLVFFHLHFSTILPHLSRYTEAFDFTEIYFCTQSPVKKGTCSPDKHLQASLISAFVSLTAHLILRSKGESQRLMTSI